VTATPTATDTPVEPDVEQNEHEDLVSEDLLVEDVSIDGMCGVY
jgi:mycofactocin precursor